MGLCTVGPVRESAERISLVSFVISASEAARNLWQTCSACAAWPRRRAGWIQRLKGSRVLVSTLIAPRSPLLAQAAWPIAALRALGLLRRQLLRNHSLRELSLLRNSSASQTRRPVGAARQCQCLTPLSQSVNAVIPRDPYIRCKVGGQCTGTHPHYSAVFYAGVQ